VIAISRSLQNEPAPPIARGHYTSEKSHLSRVWRSPYVLLTLAVLFWSGNFIVGRATAGIVRPVALAFWRWTIGLVLVASLGAPYMRREWRALVKHWPVLLVLGGLGIAAFNTLVYVGLQTTTAVNALLLQSAMPVIILAATFLIYGERASVRQALGVAISVSGIIVISAKGDLRALSSLTFSPGDLWVLRAVLAYALYSVLLRKRPVLHPLSFLAAIFSIGAAMLLPLYVHEHMTMAQVQPILPAYLAIAYVGIFPGFLSYLLYNRGVELAGANTAGHAPDDDFRERPGHPAPRRTIRYVRSRQRGSYRRRVGVGDDPASLALPRQIGLTRSSAARRFRPRWVTCDVVGSSAPKTKRLWPRNEQLFATLRIGGCPSPSHQPEAAHWDASFGGDGA